MSDLRQVGIIDPTFQLLTVDQLIADGILHRPMDGNHGEQHPKVSDYVSEGIPFIMANDIANGRIDYESCNFITMKQADALRKGFSKPGDVLVTHKATIGRTALVGEEASPYIMLTPQVTYYRIKNLNILNNRYLRHYFDCELFQKTLSIWAGAGSTRAYLGITGQRKLPIVVPPLSKQLKIAAILTAYDDLIEINKRRIALLEKMADELYREWFVRLRFPGYQNTRFVKGVPEGWTIRLLPELTEITYGFPFQSQRFNNTGVGRPIIRIRNIPSSSTEDYTDEEVADKYLVNTGDLLIGMDGEFHINHWHGDQAYLVQRVCRIRAKQPELFGFLSLAIGPPIKHLEAILASSGATVGHLGAKHLNAIEVLVPPEEMRGELEFLNNLFEQRLNLQRTNRNLAKTRDLLLPRLISGKLSVEDLDIQFPPSMLDEADGGDGQAA